MLGEVSAYLSDEKEYTTEDLLRGFDDVRVLNLNAPGREKACIIVAAANFPETSFYRREDDLVISADAGLKHLLSIGETPDLILGDFDSVEEAQREYIRKMQAENPAAVRAFAEEKDDTDTMAAVKIGLGRGYKLFFLYGCLGGRRPDHTLANLQILQYLKNHGAMGMIAEGDAGFLLLHDEAVMVRIPEHFHVSVFSVSDRSDGVTLRGLKYGMEQGTLKRDYPLGVSNSSLGKQALIAVEKGDLLLYAAHEEHDKQMRSDKK